MFMYSLIASFLVGNLNVVRVSPRRSATGQAAVRRAQRVLAEERFAGFADELAVVSYAHEAEPTAGLRGSGRPPALGRRRDDRSAARCPDPPRRARADLRRPLLVRGASPGRGPEADQSRSRRSRSGCSTMPTGSTSWPAPRRVCSSGSAAQDVDTRAGSSSRSWRTVIAATRLHLEPGAAIAKLDVHLRGADRPTCRASIGSATSSWCSA